MYSCSCLRTKIKEGFKNSDLIFTGKVIEINEIKMIDSIPTPNEKKKFYIRKYNRVEFKFQIIELIKGRLNSQSVIIATSGTDEDCGNYFELDTEHLVYSYQTDIRVNSWEENRKIDPYYTSDICTRTDYLKYIKSREIKKLRRLAKRNNIRAI